MTVRLLLLALIACTSEPAPPAPSMTGSGAARRDLAAMIPKVGAAKVLGSKAPNEAYALETWCIDDPNAAAQVATALERDGWTAVRTLGTPPQLAIAAIKDDIRFSARASSNPERCAGTYLTATVMRLDKATP